MSQVLVPDLFQELTKYNPCHVPTGSKGGQFCSGGSSKLVGGHFKAGSKMAQIYSLLESGEPVGKESLKAALSSKHSAAEVSGGINHLKKVGQKSSEWEVKETAGTIQLIKKQPGDQPGTPFTSGFLNQLDKPPAGHVANPLYGVTPYAAKWKPSESLAGQEKTPSGYYVTPKPSAPTIATPAAPIPGQKLLEGKVLGPETTRKISEQYEAKLTYNEKIALKAYTGSSYMDFNNSLRKEEKIESSVASRIRDMDSAIRKHTLSEDTLFHRGTSWEAAKKYEPGFVFIDRGYHSVTTKTSPGFGQVKIRVLAKAGTNAAFVKAFSHHSGEDEVILPRGTMFKVVSINKEGFTVSSIDVETL